MINIFSSFSLLILITILSGCTATDSDSKPVQLSEHPLLNKIWSVPEQKFISEQELNQRIFSSDIILLGETHDNKQHHQLQADVVARLIKNNQAPAVAFEMLNQDKQQTISLFQQEHKNTTTITDDFAEVIEWEKSGWPEWSYYRPVFKQALENNLPVIATNLDVKQIRKVIKQGPQVLDQNYQQLLKKYQYQTSIKQELEQDIQASHCDMLPEKMLAPMLRGQQVRDLAMMSAILNSLKQNNKLVMIAGSGHTRKDYGIPWYLGQEQGNKPLNILSLAFVEISQDKYLPEDYAHAWGENINRLPFDYVWFTIRAEREDQCEKMKAYMKKKSVKR